jgi:hypothetical protein
MGEQRGLENRLIPERGFGEFESPPLRHTPTFNRHPICIVEAQSSLHRPT